MSRKALVVVLSLSVLAAVALISLVLRAPIDTGPRARILRTQSAVGGVGDALMSYKQDVGRFPTQEEGLSILEHGVDGKEPSLRDAADIHDAWGRALIYRPTARPEGPSFDLYSIGEDGIDDGGKRDDISFWSESIQRQFPGGRH